MAKVYQVITVVVGSGSETIEVRPGRYRKESIAGENGRSNTRMGTAYLTVEPSGVLSYTNRRGEQISNIADHVFLRHWRSGIDRFFSGSTTLE